MPTDDEFRRVAEDVRALARSLARDIRGAVDRARDEPERREPTSPGTGADDRDGRPEGTPGPPDSIVAAAVLATRNELRRAQMAVRQASRRHHHRHERWWLDPPGRGSPPRWDNWGRHRPPWQPSAMPADSPADGDGPVATAPLFPSSRRDRPDRRDRRDRRSRPAHQPAPPLRHRHDGSTLLGLLAVVFGLAWLAASTHIVKLSAESVLAVALVVLGGTMVVTARTDWALSRRSWPLLGGAVVMLALIVSSASPGIPGGLRNVEVGDKVVTVNSWQEVPPVIHGGIGHTEIDLTHIADQLAEPKAMAVDGVVGEVVIEVPLDLPIMLDASVVGGSISVNSNRVAEGLQQHYVHLLGPPGPAQLSLDVNAVFGTIVITQGAVRRSGLTRVAA